MIRWAARPLKIGAQGRVAVRVGKARVNPNLHDLKVLQAYHVNHDVARSRA